MFPKIITFLQGEILYSKNPDNDNHTVVWCHRTEEVAVNFVVKRNWEFSPHIRRESLWWWLLCCGHSYRHFCVVSLNLRIFQLDRTQTASPSLWASLVIYTLCVPFHLERDVSNREMTKWFYKGICCGLSSCLIKKIIQLIKINVVYRKLSISGRSKFMC